MEKPATQPRLDRPDEDLAVADAHRRFGAGLRHYFLRRGVDHAHAEELAQQTWATLWQAVRTGRYDASRSALSTFLYAIAAKIWLRDRRAQGGRSRLSADAVAGSLLGTDADLAQAADFAELLDALRDCLSGRAGGLSPEVRAVLVGVARGESDRDLAKRLGVAPSTAHARRAGALAQLRQALSRRPPERGPDSSEKRARAERANGGPGHA